MSADRVDVRYVLDEAEIPTFQERDLGDAAVLARKRAEVAKRLVVTVDGRRVALRPAGRAVLTHPAGQGGLRTTRARAAADRGGARRAARRGARRDVSRAASAGRPSSPSPGRGTAVRSSAPGRTRRTACAATRPTCCAARPTCASPRSTSRPAPARWRRPGSAAQRRGRDASRGDGADARVRRRGGRQGHPDPAARHGVRLGRGARALAGPRQDDGRRVPRRHARHAAPRGAARRDGDGDAHDRRLRARRGRAAALELHPARGPVPVAEPRVGPARGRRRRGGAALARAPARAPTRTGTTITTTTPTTTATATCAARAAERARAAGARRLGRPDPLPLGARRAAGRDRAGPDRARDAADRRVQPRAGGDARRASGWRSCSPRRR